MTRFFLTAFLTAGIACAQIHEPATRRPQATANVNAAVSLNLTGIGLLCADGRNAGSVCNLYTPGTEQYLLIIERANPEARVFNYTISVQVRGSATPRVFTGTIARTGDAPQAVTAFLQFGGIVDSYTIHIDELVAVGGIDAAGIAAN